MGTHLWMSITSRLPNITPVDVSEQLSFAKQFGRLSGIKFSEFPKSTGFYTEISGLLIVSVWI